MMRLSQSLRFPRDEYTQETPCFQITRLPELRKRTLASSGGASNQAAFFHSGLTPNKKRARGADCDGQQPGVSTDDS
jgi:hypothetical protein